MTNPIEEIKPNILNVKNTIIRKKIETIRIIGKDFKNQNTPTRT